MLEFEKTISSKLDTLLSKVTQDYTCLVNYSYTQITWYMFQTYWLRHHFHIFPRLHGHSTDIREDIT